MNRSRAALALVLSALLLVMTAAPSQAAAVTRADRRGDAPAAIDITRYHVNNGRSRIDYTLSVRDLGARGSFTVGFDSASLYYDGAGVQVTRRNGRLTSTYLHFTEDFTTRAPCAGIRARWDTRRDVVAVSIPQHCYSDRWNPIPRGWHIGVSGQLGSRFDYTSSHVYVRRG